MIWHVIEVWALLAVMFSIGCVAGAYAYGLVGRSPLAGAQAAVADAVGDALDSVKARLGMAPAWRPGRLRNLERPVPSRRVAAAASDAVAPELGADERIPAPQGVLAEVPPMSLPPVEPGESVLEESAPREVPGDARVASAMRVGEDGIVPKRPPGIAGPRGGAPDNLQRIKGIGRRNEALLNELGVFHFSQIAAWTPAEIRWVGQYLSFPERVERDDWPGQATLLAMGNETGFEKSADRRRRRRREQRQFAERMTTATQVSAPDAQATDPASAWQDEIASDPYATEVAFDPPSPEEPAVAVHGADELVLSEEFVESEDAFYREGEFAAPPDDDFAAEEEPVDPREWDDEDDAPRR